MSQTKHTEDTLSEVTKKTAPAPCPRRLRSFVLRTGRTTVGQARAFEELGPHYLIPYAPQTTDWSQHFHREAPCVLEIGFGMGEATAHIASVKPDINFIACEVHTPGVGKLMLRLEDSKLDNVRIIQHDAVEVLEHMIAPQTLAGVHIFFPDPWHKKRHNKRRLVQPGFVELLVSRLCPGGYIHCATDWEPYAQQMLEVLGSNTALINTASPSQSGYCTKPDYRPLTKFENRGKNLGHDVWDLIFKA